MFLNSLTGPLAAGIPGEVEGMWRLYQQHGKMKWEDLVEPSVELATKGVPVNKALAKAINTVKAKVEKLGKDMPAGLK